MSHEPTIHTFMDDLVARWPSVRGTLARKGMACVGCAMARFETVGEAAAAYGFDSRELLSEVTRAGNTRKRHLAPR